MVLLNCLRQVRIDAGFGMREFAEHIWLLPSDFCAIETGKREATPEEKSRICAALNVTEFPPIEPKRDGGPWIPVFVKTVDGKPLSDDECRRLYEHVNNRGG